MLTQVEVLQAQQAKRQALHDELLQQERSNANKKKGRITVIQMKRERIQPGTNMRVQMSPEEIEQRTLVYDQTEWTHTNFLENGFKVDQDIHIQHYKCSSGQDIKGVVMFCHQYGDYAGRYSFMGHTLNQAGFDLVAMDQRGFGMSGGP